MGPTCSTKSHSKTVIPSARSNDWAELSRVKIITILVGLFLMLLEVYWIVLYWWSKSPSNVPLHQRDFSALGFCWWLLSLYFITVLLFLLDEILRKYGILFGSNSNSSDSADVFMIKTAFVCMVIYLYYCFIIFLVTKLESIVSRRWN